MEKELQKIYLAYYNLLIAQGSWQAHYQILLMSEFIKLNVYTDTMIKNVKLAESNICVGIVFLHEQL